ncbi:uncharacterized protein LOC131018978 [Salvia miltiorrhiza]|uniref:uncharacterized protein LOC131018978 n=1 Tax=Salvia miltiorrhiza TaxID=226208 RepID=UPI0025ABE9DC|nr:uncharacterized protein LOC131018978 [Salvia miltiorrhiza]
MGGSLLGWSPHFPSLPVATLRACEPPPLRAPGSKLQVVGGEFLTIRYPPPLLKKKRKVILRDREGGGERLHRDYFAPDAVYGPQLFRHRFGMSRALFLRIVNALEVDPYFQQCPDACGRFDFSPIQAQWRFGNWLAWHGAYTRGDESEPTIILEVVASQDLWIWHAFFRVVGSNDDINLLNQSTLFNDVLLGNEAVVQFISNNFHHTRGCYLTDGIYPNWPVFVKSFQFPSDEKKRRFKMMQEVARKDVERAFGVARWGIIKGEFAAAWDGDAGEGSSSVPQTQFNTGTPPKFTTFMAQSTNMKDSRLHAHLRDDLVEHVWARFGPGEP